ncbi:MAG TPA: hypothetical protein VE778_02945 [Candidatus Bathyarchaeia archaeon]|jgi:hypothetical protein|nr:hypothetical protein [Candidatus Bathyarchaeia archaeon]
MPDWQELVRQRLAGLKLDAAERDEVHAELAGHLQEFCESLRAQGLDEHAALSQTWARIGDWEKLQRKIQMTRQKENTMTPRTSQLWLPSLATLLVSMIMLPVLERLGLNPHFVFLRGPRGQEHAFPVYTVWLLLLPFVGALGAYLSRRAGGTRPMTIVSGIFPALAFFAVLLLVLPFMGFLEHGLAVNARSVFHSLTDEPFGRLGVMAGWVLVPGLSLMIGVQAHLLISRRLTQRGVASL